MPPRIVELGCGANPARAEALKVDRDIHAHVDIVADLESGLGFFADGTLDEVHAYHVLEHIHDLDHLLADVVRALRPGGRLIGSVPHFSNPYFFSDPTHRRTFGLYTLCYYCENRVFTREVPRYGVFPRFLCREMQLRFASPFPMRHTLKRVVGRIVNCNRWMLEFYEENLSHLVPAYEVRFVLEKPS